MKLKKIAVLLATAALFSFAVYAQNEEESTVEGEYMSTMEDVVVQELSNSDDLENKVMVVCSTICLWMWQEIWVPTM